MTGTVKLIVILGLVIAVAGIGTTIYYKIYNSGKQEVITQQEKKLNTIKEKTNAAKTDALTTDDPRGELRKQYSRPNE